MNANDDEKRPSRNDDLGNTPAMWRQTILFLVIPTAVLFAVLWMLAR
jgi:hypothetical protein